LLETAAADPQQRELRGAAARTAAEAYGWDAVAARYSERISALSAVPRLRESLPYEFEELATTRLLATPAWRGQDRLGELLAQWVKATEPTSEACLYLLADPRRDGAPEELEARVLGTGVDLEGAGDVTVLMEAIDSERILDLHRGVSAYVPLHDACAGHERMALAAGGELLGLEDGSIARFLARAPHAPVRTDARAPIVVG
jgi:hypothetical protein